MRSTLAAITLSCAALAAFPAGARADDTGLLVSATMVKPLGGEGRVSESTGGGGEILILPNDVFVQIGGYGVLGRDVRGKTARDIYDLHFQVGLKTQRGLPPLCFYGALGLDVIAMTTRLAVAVEDKEMQAAEEERVLRGTTLGISAQVGALGRIADRGLYRVSVAYLGAIVPGTGDDLGGLVLQLALGAAFD